MRLKDIRPQQNVTLVIRYPDGSRREIELLCRIDTAIEVDYYLHGGILPYVLRELMSKLKQGFRPVKNRSTQRAPGLGEGENLVLAE